VEPAIFESADLIHRYTRADAMRGGVLIDVSASARYEGFEYPVALTAAAWVKRVVASCYLRFSGGVVEKRPRQSNHATVAGIRDLHST
jgi:hypothetical protein